MRARDRRLRIFVAHPSNVLTDHLPHGDGLVSCGFIRRLAERGHEIHIAAQRVELSRPLPSNVHIYPLSPAGDSAPLPRLLFMLRMRLLYERLQRRIGFDVIHQMNPVFTGLSLSLIGVRTPLILGTFVPRWERQIEEGEAAGWRADIKNRLHRFVAHQQQTRAAALLIASPRAISRLPYPDRLSGRIFEVPHGIEVSAFEPRTTAPSRHSILFLANVIHRKGILTLLEAFASVRRAVPDAELIIAGGGEQLDEVRRRVLTMKDEGVQVLGKIDRDRVQSVMREHSVYCLPSYGEPFATTILEAMACALPIVSTQTGGIPDLLSSEGARLVPPRDAASLALALIEVLTSRDLQHSMGRHNRRRIETHFEAEFAADCLEHAYLEIVEPRGGGAYSVPQSIERIRS